MKSLRDSWGSVKCLTQGNYEPRGEARDTVGQEKYLKNNDQTLSKYGEKRKFIDLRSSVSPKQDEYD